MKITHEEYIILLDGALKAFDSQSRRLGRWVFEQEQEQMREITRKAFEACTEGIDIGRSLLEKRR